MAILACRWAPGWAPGTSGLGTVNEVVETGIIWDHIGPLIGEPSAMGPAFFEPTALLARYIADNNVDFLELPKQAI